LTEPSAPASPEDALERVALSFSMHAKSCAALGSPFYADLCTALHDALPHHATLRALASRFDGDPVRGFFAIRLLGGVHARVLAGEAPDLARFFPSTGGRPELPAATDALLHEITRAGEALRPWLAWFPQTNEVRRSAGLLGGFLTVAAATGLPLRLLEIGASAGLNLCFDAFAYSLGPHRWGDPASPVQLVVEWRGEAAGPPWQAALSVAERRGCDLAPIDVRDDASCRRLEAYVWADQLDRLANLRAAIGIARARGVRVERIGAADFLARELAAARPGVATVIYHSVMWAYVPADERDRITRTIEAAGARASREAPLAWVRLEDASPRTTVSLRLWPDAQAERVLADAHPHVAWIHWHQGA